MAGNVPEMDFEEGELADSESDTEVPAAQEEPLKGAAKPVPAPLDLLGAVGGIAVLNNNNTIPAVQFTGHRTGGSNLMGGARGTGQPTYSKGMTMSYRESRSATSYSSDEDSHDSFSDDEDETLWRRKRMRCVENQPEGTAYAVHHTPVIKSPPKRKINNIWASVVQEQFSESVADELVYTGLTGGINKERGPESYDYKEFTEHVSDSEHGSKSPIMTSEDEDDKGDHQDEKQEDPGEQREEEKGMKRKRSAKERLGPRPGTPFPGGPITVTADDPPEKVADEIIYRLSEPKWHLIHRIVKVLGAGEALKLLSMTEDVEAAGGMPINDGSRRRTPGGVFIQLLKSTPAITKEQKDKIFAEEDRKFQERQKEERRRRRRNNRSRRRRGHSHTSENDRMEEDGTDCADAQPTSAGQDSILHDMENIPEETPAKQTVDKPSGMVEEEEEGEVIEEGDSGECKMTTTQGDEAKENVAEISLDIGENDMDL
ncbi:phosphorylated adapter RNA export protein-like isoform X1 [Branchiostoma floridae x Branchiostoma belcheri]